MIPGNATVKLTFDAWKEGKVASTTHTIPVLALTKARPASEPTAPNFILTLAPTTGLRPLQFSPDSSKLLAVGSGSVQIFNMATKKQILRLETPVGVGNPVITPDWKTIYLTTGNRKRVSVERDGKSFSRFEYSGAIRVFDAVSGKERSAIKWPEGSWPVMPLFAPNGNALIFVEYTSHDIKAKSKARVILHDLAKGERRVLLDAFAFPRISTDGKFLFLSRFEQLLEPFRTESEIEVREFATGNLIANLRFPEKEERTCTIKDISPNGSVVAVVLAGRRDMPIEYWFLDAKTLKVQGKLIGDGSPDDFGFGPGQFAPDGRYFVAIDKSAHALVWNVADQKIERRLLLGGPKTASTMTISPDSKKIAVAWAPPRDDEGKANGKPDPDDLPQPRVSILDLSGKAPPSVLIAPTHGYVGGIAFSPDGRTLALGTNGGIHLFDLTK